MSQDYVELTARTPNWVVREIGLITTIVTNAEDRLSLGLDADLSQAAARLTRLVMRLQQENWGAPHRS